MTLTINFSDTSSLVQIHNKSLREHVLEMLHGAIVNGELKPGQALVEADLAGQLGVSRAPVREAINVLATKGLVEVVPYHGTTVKKLSRKDIQELYSVRSLMEGYAIQQVILSESTEQAISNLRAVCHQMQQAADEGDLRAVNQIDRDFHDTLVAACGNDLLLSMWSTVSMRVRQVMSLRNRRKGDLQAIARNHSEIVDVIASKDLQKAIALIQHHIGMTGGAIVKDWPEEEMTMDIEAAP